MSDVNNDVANNGGGSTRHKDIPEREQVSMCEAAIDELATSELPTARRMKSSIPGEEKQGQFNRIYVSGQDVYVFEVGNIDGRREGRLTRNDRYVEKGSFVYRDDIVESMLRHAKSAGDSELRESARAIRDAIETDRLYYLQATPKVNPDGSISSTQIVRFE